MHDHSNEPSLRVLGVLHRLEMPALAAVAVVASTVLVLWLIPPIDVYAPAIWSKMFPATAVTLLLATCSLALSAPKRSARALQTSSALALAVLAVGVGALGFYAIGMEPPEARWLHWPAPQTAACFLLIGVAALLIRRTHGRWSRVADLCVVFLVGIVFFVFAGYVFLVDEFVGINASNVTSPQTLLCLALLTFVIAARRAQEGSILAVVVGSGIGSHITRVVLPAIVVVPFAVFGVIGYLDRTGILQAAYARAIAAPLEVLGVLGVVGWLGSYTNKLERELRRQSLTDELTGVFNRRGFHAVAEYTMHNATRANSGLLLFYFDLDRLKQTNDHHGHEVGSMLIKRFAELLAESFRKSDIVARVGGDEFVVLASADAETAQDMLTRLQQRVLEDNSSGTLPVAICYSSGHSELRPRAKGQIDQLVAQADAIMYEEKRRKRMAA
jgi:diguanylate cyclase (GGDEF)-like protein